MIRQDAWSEEDDLILAEIVLQHIREGSTQLAAFEEVGKRLKRTSAACGFRWNSIIRQKYENEIALARQKRPRNRPVRKKKAPPSKSATAKKDEEPTLTITDVIRFLSTYEPKDESELIIQLKKENEQLRTDLASLQKKYDKMERDYTSIVSILNRARHLYELS